MASQLDRKLISPGNNTDYPRKGDKVTIEYTGWLYDSSRANNEYKGDKYVFEMPHSTVKQVSLHLTSLVPDSIALSVEETFRLR